MKRLKFLVFILAITIFSCNSIDGPRIYDYDLDEPYDFPIKPGMPEWAELTPYEMGEVLQIPDDILKRLSTRALVETCLNYPRFPEFGLSSSTPKVGVSWVIIGFNGFGELFLRRDAFTYLFVKYALLNPDAIDEDWDLVTKGQFSVKFMCIEILLFQDEIINSMSYEEKILLLKESYSKYKKMLKNEEVYGWTSYQFIFYLMTTLLVAIDEPDITDEINNSTDINHFLDSMWPNGYAFEKIEILVNKVINKRNH
jgi:hypothetical protein